MEEYNNLDKTKMIIVVIVLHSRGLSSTSENITVFVARYGL